MKTRARCFLFFMALCLFGCGSQSDQGGSEAGNPSSDSVGLAVGSSVDSVSSNLGSETNGLLAFHKIKPSWINSVAQELSPVSKALANVSTGGCSDQDSAVTVTAECSETNHTATITRDFGPGCNAGSNITVTGKRYVSWNRLGSGACSTRSSRPRFVRAIEGSGAKQILSTDVISSESCGKPTTTVTRTFKNGAELQIKSCAELEYSSVQNQGGNFTVTEKLTIPEEDRIRLQPNGTKLFDHTISTEQPLVIETTKEATKNLPTRKITSGTITVSHNLAKYTVHSTFSNVLYDYNTCDCHPVSGSISVTVTDNTTGATTSSGQVTFKETETGNCDSIDAMIDGKEATLSLGSCRGL